MNPILRRLRDWPVRWFGLVALAGLIVSCGGGVGTGGTGSFAVGPITGFGSIIVNGVRFEDGMARIETDDGSPSSSAALRLGMMVEVDAGAVLNALAAAARVRIVSERIGLVDAIDPIGASLTVNGQRVRTNAATVFDDQFVGGLAGVAVGSVVEVYGFSDGAAGTMLATRIEPRTGATAFKFRGELTAMSSAARTFQIGTQLFDYAGLASAPPNLATGSFVRVLVNPARDASGRWVVTALSSGVPVRDNLVAAEIDGLITEFVSNANLRVNGLPVDASAAAITGGPLAVGVRVEAEGLIQDGVLVARKVTVQSEDAGGQFELHGTLGSVDTNARTFTLVGRSEVVGYGSPGLVFENGNAGDLQPGRRVEVKGVLSADRTRIEATKIEFGG